MKKKILALCLVVVSVFSLSGCAKTVELTDEQEEQVVEYIAGTMLKYSYANKWDYTKVRRRIGYYENKTEPTTQVPTQAPTTTKPSATSSSMSDENKDLEESEVIKNLISAIGLEACSVSFDGIVVGDRYPTAEYTVSVPANLGCKVVACEFTITNNSGAVNTITTRGSTTMKFTIGEKTYSQLSTPLINDISTMANVKLNNMENYKVVALFQVDEALASQAKSGKLSIYKGNSHAGDLYAK